MNILWEIPLRTLIIYAVVLAGLRLSGKRQIGQLTPFDLVLLLLIANAVQNAMTGPDDSLLGGVLSAGTLLLADRLLAWARTRFPALRRVLVGKPTALVRDGEIQTSGLEQEELTEDELLAALREHGVEDITKVELATLETDGSISVVPRNHERLRGRRRAVRFIKATH